MRPPSRLIPTAVIASRIDRDILSPLFAQQRLYFWPLPQGQGALRPTADIGHLSPEPDAGRRASDAIVELLSVIRKLWPEIVTRPSLPQSSCPKLYLPTWWLPIFVGAAAWPRSQRVISYTAVRKHIRVYDY
jgi:hypothetical protein